jgi:AraC-like DNA-binding protein
MVKLLINILLIMASVFGFYASFRLYPMRRTHLFYIMWLVLESSILLFYFLLKNEINFLNPIFLEIFSTIFYLSSGFLYIAITIISNNKKTITHYIVALSPLLLFAFIKVAILVTYYDDTFERVQLYNISINTNSVAFAKNQFQIEKIIFAFLHIVSAIYMVMIGKMLKKQSNAHLNQSWEVIFKPFRINVYFIGFLMIAQIFIEKVFHCAIPDYFFINLVITIAAIMHFWHISLLLKDLENSDSIFKHPTVKPIKNPGFPQKSIDILQYIYLEKMFTDNTLSLEKVADTIGIPDVKLAKIFSTTIPFTFSTYINYLRLLEYEKLFNSKLDKISNVRNVGFNSIAAFYYWESKKMAISEQINPILEWIDHQETAKIPNE